MNLDVEKFEDMVRRDNDIGSILKYCGDMLTTNGEDKVSSLVTVGVEYSKGSVDAARGQSTNLTPSKFERANTVVRNVEKSLNSKGMVMDSPIRSSYSDGEGDKLKRPFPDTDSSNRVKPPLPKKHGVDQEKPSLRSEEVIQRDERSRRRVSRRSSIAGPSPKSISAAKTTTEFPATNKSSAQANRTPRGGPNSLCHSFVNLKGLAKHAEDSEHPAPMQRSKSAGSKGSSSTNGRRKRHTRDASF